MKGLVIKSTGSWYMVKDVNGTILECRIKGKIRMDGSKNTNPVAVGDNVEFELESEEDKGVITKIDPRRNYIIRKSTNLSKQSHIIAANIDRAFLLVTIAMPRTSTGFIDRFLVTAEAYHIPASLLFSKIDMYDEKDKAELERMRRLYENLGYTCFEISSLKGIGIVELKRLLKGKSSLLAGHSGVGKSALVNALDTTFSIKTGHLSEAHDKGRHTTTYAELFELADGGAVIDTPGIKEFGMFDLRKEELSHYFPEMKALFNKCKYNSCLHLTEPGCAVKLAVEAGEIAGSRYNSYLGIMNSGELDKKYSATRKGV
jgi:ribosome biogenesis GTPase